MFNKHMSLIKLKIVTIVLSTITVSSSVVAMNSNTSDISDLVIKKKEIITSELKKDKSLIYAYYYARLIMMNVEEREARDRSFIYEQEINKQRSCYYADYYAMLKVRGEIESKARVLSEIYEREVYNKKSFSYADYYARLIVERGMNKEQARVQAEEHFK